MRPQYMESMEQRSIIILLVLIAFVYIAVRWSHSVPMRRSIYRPPPYNYDAILRSFDG